MRLARVTGAALGSIAVVCVAALALSCGPRADVDCYDGLAVGEVIRLTLVAPYTMGGDFTWVPHSPSSLPPCTGVDRLATGASFDFRLVRRFAGGNQLCAEYAAVPADAAVGVTFPADAALAGTEPAVLASSGPVGCGGWTLQALRPNGLDSFPFDEVATPGQLPPVFVQRSMVCSGTGATACADEWVGQVEIVR